MRHNIMKAKLRSGEPVAGVIIASADEQLVEVLGRSGFHYVMIDCEHGHMGVREAECLVRAAELVDVTPVIRVPHNEPHEVLRYLDTGAHGVIIPQVNTREDAEKAVQAAYYHPIGRRGLAGTRAADYGLGVPLGEYTQQANEELMVIGLIENVKAIDNLPEILSVEGLTAVTIGPADLSQSLGHPGQRRHPEVEQAIEAIRTAAAEAGVPCGVNTSSGEDAREARAQGFQITSVSAWGILAGAARNYLETARG